VTARWAGDGGDGEQQSQQRECRRYYSCDGDMECGVGVFWAEW
jgi:hypothetical protein